MKRFIFSAVLALSFVFCLALFSPTAFASDPNPGPGYVNDPDFVAGDLLEFTIEVFDGDAVGLPLQDLVDTVRGEAGVEDDEAVAVRGGGVVDEGGDGDIQKGKIAVVGREKDGDFGRGDGGAEIVRQVRHGVYLRYSDSDWGAGF